MTLKSRVEKAVEMSGVGLPCWLCEASREAGDAFNAYMLAHGVPHPPPVIEETRCIACKVLKPCDFSGLSEDARAACRRMKVALEDYQAGRVEWVEVERTWHEYEEVEMIGSAEIFGEHYPAARAVLKAVIDRHIREATDEQLRQLQPDGATNIKRRRAGGS